MNIKTNAPAPLILLIGIALLAGACALAYFSSPATLKMKRTSPSSVDVAIEDRLFGVWLIATDRFTGVRAALSLSPRPEGSTSRTSTGSFLFFDTTAGRVFAGPSRQVFLRDLDAIQGFIADPSRAELALPVTDRSEGLLRFLFAQACVLFLALVGAFLLWLGMRTLFPDPNAGIGPH